MLGRVTLQGRLPSLRLALLFFGGTGVPKDLFGRLFRDLPLQALLQLEAKHKLYDSQSNSLQRLFENSAKRQICNLD